MKKLKTKIIVFLVGFICCEIGNIVNAGEITIKAGTPIPLRLDETVSSETATAGSTVRFTVTRDVKVDNVVVIEAGSPADGEITHAQKAGSLGEEGAVSLVLRYTTAVDGTRVPLRAQLSEVGEERVALSWMVCPFIKGTKSRIEAGTETKGYVDYDTKITVKE